MPWPFPAAGAATHRATCWQAYDATEIAKSYDGPERRILVDQVGALWGAALRGRCTLGVILCALVCRALRTVSWRSS